MANWQLRIDFSETTKSYRAGEITLQQLAREVARQLTGKLEAAKRTGGDYAREELEIVRDLFEEIANDDTMSVDDYDNALEQLYDWGDTSLDGKFGGMKMCWIEPSF